MKTAETDRSVLTGGADRASRGDMAAVFCISPPPVLRPPTDGRRDGETETDQTASDG